MASVDTKVVEVAAAVLQRLDGTFLLAQRPAGKAYAGYWEFPGGKVEPGETARAALERELREELGIRVVTAYPWLTRVFTYPHATVQLKFFRVTAWLDEPHPHEGQQFAWQTAREIMVAPLLPANTPIIRALQLPALYGISNATELGAEVFLQRLELALRRGLRLVQIREKEWAPEALKALVQRTLELARPYGAIVLLNGDVELAQEVGAHGVQLTAKQLDGLADRPDVAWCAASCHNLEEIRRAEKLGVDFVCLSPVLPTKSHPGAPHLGWEKFQEIAGQSGIPVYALGGMTADSAESAWQHGAHGIALLRQAW